MRYEMTARENIAVGKIDDLEDISAVQVCRPKEPCR